MHNSHEDYLLEWPLIGRQKIISILTHANNTLYDSYDSITKPVCSWHNDMWLHFCPRLRFDGSRGAIRKTNINCLFNMHIWNASFDNIIVICLTRRWLKSFVSEIFVLFDRKAKILTVAFTKFVVSQMRLCLNWLNDSWFSTKELCHCWNAVLRNGEGQIYKCNQSEIQNL